MKHVDALLSSLLQGHQRRKFLVSIPFSRACWSIASILSEEGYIRTVYRDGKHLKIVLKYVDDVPAIRGMRRHSRSGCRVYTSARALRKHSQGLGMSILTTPQGFMCDRDAKNSGCGGELVCQVW